MEQPYKYDNDAPRSQGYGSKGLGIASLVLGCVGSAGCWMPIASIFAFIAATVGVFLGSSAVKIAKSTNEPIGLPRAGYIVSLVAAFVSLFLGVLVFTVCQFCRS